MLTKPLDKSSLQYRRALLGTLTLQIYAIMQASSPLAHRGVRLIAGGWAFFITENVVVSENRDKIISFMGSEGRYIGLYGTLSTAACGSIALGYFQFGRGKGPILWRPTTGMRAAAFALQAAGFVGLSQLAPPLQLPFTITSFQAPTPPHQHPPISDEAAAVGRQTASSMGMTAQCPIDFSFREKLAGNELAGTKRITRHPQLWSLTLLGLGSAIGNALLTEVTFGAAPLFMTLIGGAHQDLRHLRSGVLHPDLMAKTSHLPFYAMICQTIEEGFAPWTALADEMAWTNAGLAIVVAAVVATRRGTRVSTLLRAAAAATPRK